MTKIYLYLLLIILLFSLTHAQWSEDPTINTSICNAANNQSKPAITSDGSGGAIMVWDDDRTNTFTNDIFAQRVDASGVVQWTVDGVDICTAAGYQSEPKIISDGAGGAIIVWNDVRNGFPNNDIYAQRIDPNGSVLWNSNGVIVCNASGVQGVTGMISDGEGGAIIVWDDNRSGLLKDVYSQRIDSNGNRLWTSTGVPISTFAEDQGLARIVTDGNGGAIVAWNDTRFTTCSIFAQKIDVNGNIQWAVNGIEVCSPGLNQFNFITPQICSDGTGGAIITWDDSRVENESDVFVQRINLDGVVQWAEDGIPVADSLNVEEGAAVITSDNAGGAIISWIDNRNGTDFNVYAQRVNASGIFQWNSAGILVCDDLNNQTQPQIISDNSNGAIIIWSDERNNNYDLFVQKINSSGILQWGTGGIAVATAVNFQVEQRLITNESNGAIAVWTDWRTGGLDIYAQNITQDGVLPVELFSFSASLIGTEVKLSWMTMTEVNNYGFEIERLSEDNSGWQIVGFVRGNGNSNSVKTYSFIDSEINSGRLAYRLRQIDNDGSFEYSNEIEVDFNLPIKYELIQNYPNPFNPSTKIRYSIPNVRSGLAQTVLKVYDVLGNEIATLVNEYKPAGSYEVTFDASSLSTGVYFYKLQSGSFVETKKMILLN